MPLIVPDPIQEASKYIAGRAARRIHSLGWSLWLWKCLAIGGWAFTLVLAISYFRFWLKIQGS